MKSFTSFFHLMILPAMLCLSIAAGLFLSCKSKPAPTTEELELVQSPEFIINSIAILKAELVNTRFRVGLKINNPNPFPLELSSFSYELYGNGRLWADGIEKNVLTVDANSSLEGNLFLIMNFIDMERSLLDQIIMLEDVNYRFSGNAHVNAIGRSLPGFNSSFEISGYSIVLDE